MSEVIETSLRGLLRFLVVFDFFSDKRVVAGYSTDCGGSWRYNTKEDHANYELLAKEFGVSANRLVRVHQNHTNNILVVDGSNGGEGAIKEGSADFYDGIITREENLMLCVVTADCVPVFLFDSKNNVAGIVHSGKAGTAKAIVANAVLAMQERFNTRTENLQCILGPYISQKNYQLQKKDIVEFDEHFTKEECERFILAGEGGYYPDLGEAIAITLEKVGVNRKNIFDSRICTFDNKDLFSFRRDRIYKHLISFIMIKRE